ncbi:hypothetical protein CEUSTIGMA_g13190.t1 [Chlamydomonas eustigma]|uniref:DUF1232 domain-containing protein n=1 Tax=Chlamydomonas eustigma TaxID=1157962 RepID=A0A250XRU5_9CHLO|nr:hypothetical protein CEUSTIGMA_g13190.t1 [Chlamydomonas eustigma]|eukprot:GAX85775.1 hypothetical protein CEUSTIGMA_g13190.t1 [Chlamydomonas eustigma]
MLSFFYAAVKRLKRQVLTLYYAVQDDRTPFYCKILPWVALAYALSPLDLIPDFIPILGLVDDLILLPGMIWLSIQLIPNEVMQDAALRAEREPLRLSSNWVAAVVIFVLWVVGIESCTYYIITQYGSPDLQLYIWEVIGGSSILGTVIFSYWIVTSMLLDAERSKLKSKLVVEDMDLEDGEAAAMSAVYSTHCAPE